MGEHPSVDDPSLWSIGLSWVAAISLALALAATAGLRAWLPLLVAGVLAKAGVADLGDGFAWLASWPALTLFGLATVLEIAGDKIPALDHALDAVGTFVRPLTGALAAAAVLVQVEDPMIALVIGLLVGAPTALAPHAAKATVRAVSTGTTGGLANPVISFVEDALAIAMAILAFLLPILAGLLVLVLAFFTWRWIRKRRAAARKVTASGVAI
jgi:hypothetical protein